MNFVYYPEAHSSDFVKLHIKYQKYIIFLLLLN